MRIIHAASTSTVQLDRMCVGRIGVLQCREKCWKNGVNGKFARCIRHHESPFIKRCLCHIRRSPLHHVDGGSYHENDLSLSKNESFARKGATDVDWLHATTSWSANFQDQAEMERNEVLIQESVCARKNGDEMCNRNCKTSHIDSSGECQVVGDQVLCRCSSCVISLCDFEKNECGWLDMNAVYKNFGNFSIASKHDQRNHYGLSRISSRSRSGLYRRGPFNGPLTLSLDIYPTEAVNVKICIDNLQKCQTLKVLSRLWNRARAKINVKKAYRIFILFLNLSNEDQTMAIDNVWMRSGQCSMTN